MGVLRFCWRKYGSTWGCAGVVWGVPIANGVAVGFRAAARSLVGNGVGLGAACWDGLQFPYRK